MGILGKFQLAAIQPNLRVNRVEQLDKLNLQPRITVACILINNKAKV